MDRNIEQRRVYASLKQKKKLIELMTKNPKLVTCKMTNKFTSWGNQKLWQQIANECNSIPGARKTWTQWRKTWQDLRCNTKKKGQRNPIHLTNLATILSPEEQEILGLKNVSSATTCKEEPVFVSMDQEGFNNEVDSNASYYNEPETEVEEIVLQDLPKHSKENSIEGNNELPTKSCVYNCDKLVVQEERNMKLKEDYYEFKKDYLRQKLILMKEQTEALQRIADGLNK